MDDWSKIHFIQPSLLFIILMLSLEFCDDQTIQLDTSSVQFTLSSGINSQGGCADIDCPENAKLQVTIRSSSGTTIF